MKYINIFIFQLLCLNGIAQSIEAGHNKPSIDTSVFGKWPAVFRPAITNDGNFGSFIMVNTPVPHEYTLVLKGIDNPWTAQYTGVKNEVVFTSDSKKAIFIKGQDSMCVLVLGSSQITFVPNVASFNLFKSNNKEWLLYSIKRPVEKLLLTDFESRNEKSFGAVTDYYLSKNASTLLLKKKGEGTDTKHEVLEWIDLETGNVKQIWAGPKVESIVLSEKGDKLAFLTDSSNDKPVKSCWYYQAEMDKPICLIEDTAQNVVLTELQKFSTDGGLFFAGVQEKPKVSERSGHLVNVDVWSYLDPQLQSQQLQETNSTAGTAAISVTDKKIIFLQHEGEDIRVSKNGDAFFITKSGGGDGGNQGEWFWNKRAKNKFYIGSSHSGERLSLAVNYPQESPDGKYILGSDSPVQSICNNVLIYNRETKSVVNITKSLPVPEDVISSPLELKKQRMLFLAGWLEKDDAVLIYDNYDLWKLDLNNKKPPVNITNSYGRRKNIVFRLASINYTNDGSQRISGKDVLFLHAFDRRTKKSGFYKVHMMQGSDPEPLLPLSDVKIHLSVIKARDAECYIIKKENIDKSPNYFWTKDFKSLHELSAVYPEQQYNWMSSALISWKKFDGSTGKGVLYKPENFDSSKKYPIIFDYYETRTNELNEYKIPETALDRINIPWFVSRGYLVFTPDIEYKSGDVGASVYNTVVSAAKYLGGFRWVDKKHMGLQGHSFGGYETNYLVTHTNIFAAAMSASGVSELISHYGSLWGSGSSKQYALELGQYRMGYSLWTRPELYIKNSPIFSVEKVQTPLLMMNNKNDKAVPFTQGVEFFSALRKLGKKVWMLQYDEGSHSLRVGSREAMDYHIRVTQFFDHYLKGAPAPIWMTRGIPAKLKAIEDGLKVDNEIKTPGPGLINLNNSPQ